MKHRITYVVKDPDTFSPDQLKVVKQNGKSPTKFIFENVNAAKEHRITMGLDELPDEFQKLFKQWQQIHFRLTNVGIYRSTPPFTSRSSPGLHVFFTPLDGEPDADLCQLLHRVYFKAVKCSSVNEAAIKMSVIPENASTSPSMHFYSAVPASGQVRWVPSLRNLARNMRERFYLDNDLFEKLADEVDAADYVDLDYDATTQTVVFAFQSTKTFVEPGSWTDTISLPEKESTIEIGVLSHEFNSDPEDIQFGGVLTVLGRDDAPKPARFQTPTRHYPLLDSVSYSPAQTPKRSSLRYYARVTEGMHPTFDITFQVEHLTPPDPTCKLHTYLTLPSGIFVDRYQFTDPLFLQSKNIISLRSLAGATDLEAPDWAIKQWGSASLFELAHPEDDTNATEKDWTVSIPLHLRYQPANDGDQADLEIPYPPVFWACHADAGPQMAGNPFDRVHLGYDALFEPHTRFMHVEPSVKWVQNRRLVRRVSMPTLERKWATWIEAGTVGTVVVAFLWLCWVLFGKKGRSGSGESVERKKTQ